MEKKEIDINKQLNPGDRIELHYSCLGLVWVTAAQIAMIESRLEGREGYRIRSSSMPAKNKVIFEVEITKTNPVIITAAVISAGIIGAGVIAWLTLDKVYQIIEAPAGKIAAVGVGSLGIAAAAAVVAALVLGKK